jgi:hypothetical protein
MLREGADSRSFASRRWALASVLAVSASLLAPQVVGATGNVTVTVNPPQFDPKDGNYGVFSGSVTNAPIPDSNSGCQPIGGSGCIAQFALYPAGVPASLQVGPALVWGVQNTPNPTQVAVTINLSTAPGVVPGTTYQATLQAYDTAGLLWESGRTQPFQWPPDKLTLSKVRLLGSAGGDSAIRYQLDHGGTPFRGKARVKGSILDGSEKLGTFTHKVRPGARTRLLPDSIDGSLVDGQRYRVRLDAKDSLGREASFRGQLER